MLDVGKTKSLSPEENAELRKRLDLIIKEQFEGVEASALGELKISQAYLNQFRNGDKGAGVKMVRAIERLEQAGAARGFARPTDKILHVSDYHGPPTDPISADWAMRWRALLELVKHGKDAGQAFQVLAAMKFDESQRPPSWGDYFSRATDDMGSGAAGQEPELVDPKALRPHRPKHRYNG